MFNSIKKLRIIYFYLFFLLNNYLFASEISNYPPLKQANAIKEYLEIIGASPDRSHNIDIAKYNAEIVDKNPCLKELATNFYYRLSLKGAKSTQYLADRAKPLPSNVSLDETALSIGLEPGWLWKEALEISSNDKNLAIQLIGICGHDDKYQMNGYSFTLTDSQRKELSTHYKKRDSSFYIERNYREAIDSYNVPLSKAELKRIRENVEDFYVKSLELNNGIVCPAGRDEMFYPQSLGVDTSTDLKEKIAKFQAPSKGPSYLPAKAYHIMGSAYTSCFLLQKGVPEEITKELVLTAVNGYRGTTMCGDLKSKRISIDPKLDPDEIVSILESIRTKRKNCEEGKNKNLCTQIINIMGERAFFDKAISSDQFKRKILKIVSKEDVSVAFFDSINSLFALKCNGLQITNALRSFLEKRALWNNYKCPSEMNTIRCENMRKLISTWAIDFEWSEQQHLIGFNFAKENCPQLPAGTTIEQRACEVLKNKNANSIKSVK